MDLPCGASRPPNKAGHGMRKDIAVLAAGGTGGHLFPALALAEELEARGWEVHLATDARARRYTGEFPVDKIHIIASGNPSGRNPLILAAAMWKLFLGYMQSRRLVGRIAPNIVVGFGGYPTLPPMIAAQRSGIANIVHEANAVTGRANRLLARRAGLVAMGFGGNGGNVVVTGNPVRPAVLSAAGKSYPKRKPNSPFRLLVFGGSQGAQFFGEVVPPAVDLLEPGERKRLRIVHQVRAEQRDAVSRQYKLMEVQAQTAPFFENMPARIAAAHFVVARAGALTVTELGVIGRPALLVPYPYALDQDQAKNAESLAIHGGAFLASQMELTPEKLSMILKNAMEDPQKLAKMAESAKRTAKPDAAKRLADLAERLAVRSRSDERGLNHGTINQ